MTLNIDDKIKVTSRFEVEYYTTVRELAEVISTFVVGNMIKELNKLRSAIDEKSTECIDASPMKPKSRLMRTP